MNKEKIQNFLYKENSCGLMIFALLFLVIYLISEKIAMIIIAVIVILGILFSNLIPKPSSDW